MDFQLNYVRFDLEHASDGHSKLYVGTGCTIIFEDSGFGWVFLRHTDNALSSGPANLAPRSSGVEQRSG